MNGGAREPLDIVAAIGGAFGMAGTFVGPDALRQELWLVDGVALVVATALLAVKFMTGGRDLVAAGFIVFVAGESLVLAGNAAGLQASVPSYGGGVALWAASLAMISARGLPAVDAAHGRRRSASLRCDCGAHRLGPAASADLHAAADGRLSLFGADVPGMDLEAAQSEALCSGLTSWPAHGSILKARLRHALPANRRRLRRRNGV